MEDFTLLAVRETKCLLGDTAGNFYVAEHIGDDLLISLRSPVYWNELIIKLPVPGLPEKTGELPFRQKKITGWPEAFICAFDYVDRRWFVYKGA